MADWNSIQDPNLRRCLEEAEWRARRKIERRARQRLDLMTSDGLSLWAGVMLAGLVVVGLIKIAAHFLGA